MSFGFRRFVLFLISIVKLWQVYCLRLFINKNPSEVKKNSLLILKLDEIGDYILFRNFLKYFKKSKKFRNYNITLCGNSVWKDIFLSFDKDYVNSTIWIDKKKYLKEFTYRKNIIKRINNNFETIINCSYSRNFLIDDTFVKFSNSTERIGFVTDTSSQFHWQKKISDKYYTRLIKINDSDVFDFNKNKTFIHKVLQIESEYDIPFIEKNPVDGDVKIDGKFAVFYVGGRSKYKIWEVSNFIEIAKYVNNKFGLKIILVGSSEEIKYSKSFSDNFDENNLIDFTSKTTLIDIINLLSKAEIFISNDSGLAHIAAAIKTKLVIIANGTHYGRFFPYPQKYVNYVKAIYPYPISKSLNNYYKKSEKYKFRSKFSINSISIENVKCAVDELLVN